MSYELVTQGKRKANNPPHCPEFKFIDKYWSIVKGKLQKKGMVMKAIEDFRALWNLTVECFVSQPASDTFFASL